MPTKRKNQKTLHKIPRSNRYKDLIFFILFSTLTISSIGLFSFIESQNNILYFKNFDMEYIETDYLYKFGIEGSRYITNNMQEIFICHVPKFTKNVWVKFNDDSDWIKIPESRSFKLKARKIKNCTVYLRCDSKITQCTTIIYQQDLPIIEIECNDLITYSKVKCDIRLSPNNKLFEYSSSKYNWAYKKLKANIKLRDSTNGYEIELRENSNLLNMRNDDDWLLIPSRKNSSALRIKLALDLYNSLREKDYLCSLPKAEPVDLYINNVYKGLHLLMEKPDKKLFGINDSKDLDILIKAENWYGHGKTIWNQIAPQNKELNKDIIKLENFILTSSDKEFFNNENGIFTKINRTQIIDLILFELLIGHNSIEGSKIFIIRKEKLNSTFYFAPWDFDMSWGFSRKKNLSYEDWITINANITSFCKFNHLFYRLLFPKDSSLNQQFRIDLLNRWKELNSTIWKKTFLINKISALYEYMKKGLLRNNYNEKTENVYKRIERWVLSRYSKLEDIARKHITLNLYSKLPSIYITFQEELTKKRFISCNFELYNSFPHEKHVLPNSSIKFRGRTTWNDAKPGYSLELSKKVSLLGMRDDDDWYLLSMQLDYTRMRTKLAFDLWRSLSASNPTCILPKSRYVNLFLNNEYNGLYLLSERIDKKLFNLNNSQSNINSSLIFNIATNNNLSIYNSNYWEQEWPNEDLIVLKDEILPQIIDFIMNKSDDDFFNNETGIYSIFDKKNLIDFFIFELFIDHMDSWHANYLIIRDTYPAHFFLCPWDFDYSFGQRACKLYINKKIDIGVIETIGKDNALFKRLLNNSEFIQACKDRWNEIRQELWNEEFIIDFLSNYYNSIKNVLYPDIFEFPWNPLIVEASEPIRFSPSGKNKEFKIEDYINHLYQYIPERLEICDEFFETWNE